MKHFYLFITLALFTCANIFAQDTVAYYSFDNSLLDGSTNSYDLSPSENFTPTYVAGYNDEANGAVTGFADSSFLATAINFPISGDKARAFAAWIKTDSSTVQAIAGLGERVNYTRWSFTVNKTVIRAEVKGAGKSDTTIVNDGEWHHVVASYGQDSLLLYVDGKRTNWANWTTDLNTTETPLRIGNDYNTETPARAFGGAIDEVIIYDSSLTDTLVLALYNSYITGGNGGGGGGGETSSTKGNELTDQISTYPNPTTGYLHFTSNKVSSVDIYNLLGSKIASRIVNNNSIDVRSIASGVYFLKCKDHLGNQLTSIKVIKK